MSCVIHLACINSNDNHMFAVVRSGGKQYCVRPQVVIKVDLLNNIKQGDEFVIKDVPFASANGVMFYGKGLSIKARLLENKLSKKILIFKKRRRENYRRKKGHRQDLSVIRILDFIQD